MHVLLGVLLAVALEQGMRRRPSPPPEPQWLFWRQPAPLRLAGAMNGEMWFVAPGAGVLHEGGAVEVLDKDFNDINVFFVPKEYKLCSVQAGSIHCVSRTGGIQEIALPAGVTVGGPAFAPDGSLWFSEAPAKRIGVLRPDGTLHEIALPESMFPVSRVAVDRNGEVWLPNVGSVVHLRRDETFDVISDGAFPKQSWSPVPADDGAIWIVIDNGGHRSNPNATVTTIRGLGWGESYGSVLPMPDGSLWVRIDSWNYPFTGLAFQHIWPDETTLPLQTPSTPRDFEPGFYYSSAFDSSGRVWICFQTFSGGASVAKLLHP